MKQIKTLSLKMVSQCRKCKGNFFYLSDDGQVCVFCGEVNYLTDRQIFRLKCQNRFKMIYQPPEGLTK